MRKDAALQELEKAKNISVIITSYNQKEFLIETIESVLNQTIKPYEIIIADDHSTDGSVELIDDYVKQYPHLIKPIFHKKNLGIAKNRNSAFKKARGDMITWINGDDKFLPRKLELELKTYLKNPGVRWVYSQVFYINSTGERKSVRFKGKYRTNAYTFKDVVTRVGIDPTYQLIDSSILNKVGLFDEDLSLYEDWDFVIRLAKNYKFAYCPIPLAEYRQHGGGASSAGEEFHLRAIKKIYQKVLPLIENIPENESREIKRKFSAGIYEVSAYKKFDEGKRFEARKYLIKAIKGNPKNATLYKLCAKFYLPNGVFEFLRRMKRKLRIS